MAQDLWGFSYVHALDNIRTACGWITSQNQHGKKELNAKFRYGYVLIDAPIIYAGHCPRFDNLGITCRHRMQRQLFGTNHIHISAEEVHYAIPGIEGIIRTYLGKIIGLLCVIDRQSVEQRLLRPLVDRYLFICMGKRWEKEQRRDKKADGQKRLHIYNPFLIQNGQFVLLL
ncbi:hypothetical protein Lsha_0075 [Legionella shakespearei DSM 23087]|uniref:Uncharacterized protein n=1 Tax=Legionella shakespearei DSM 23087 TaxID=1122169 RepID=A0A0W0ZCA2_9GAMM|nr:hypothetical protein Lsha_0075 [Legionella shakespearei DSM 23087]